MIDVDNEIFCVFRDNVWPFHRPDYILCRSEIL